jgi:hypothetical protein
MISAVPSGEESSTKRISKSSAAIKSSDVNLSTFFDSLYVGMTTSFLEFLTIEILFQP